MIVHSTATEAVRHKRKGLHLIVADMLKKVIK